MKHIPLQVAISELRDQVSEVPCFHFLSSFSDSVTFWDWSISVALKQFGLVTTILEGSNLETSPHELAEGKCASQPRFARVGSTYAVVVAPLGRDMLHSTCPTKLPANALISPRTLREPKLHIRTAGSAAPGFVIATIRERGVPQAGRR